MLFLTWFSHVFYTHKIEFSKLSPLAQLSRWNVWENWFQREQKQFSNESSRKSHSVRDPLGVSLSVLGQCPALSQQSQQWLLLLLGCRAPSLLIQLWTSSTPEERITGLQLCPGAPIWELREGPNFLVHSNIILHREYQAKLFPWPSRATVVQRSHWTVNVWSSLLCPEHSREEVFSFNQLLFSSCFSSVELHVDL